MKEHAQRDTILIAGAGLAGLSAAFHLQERGETNCRLVEAEARPGGWAKTDWTGPYGADRGGHVLYFRNPEIHNWVHDLIGGNWNQFNKKCLIDSQGIRTHFPFHANLCGRPSAVVKECLSGLWETSKGRKDLRTRPSTFADWILQHYGEGVDDHFMRPYNNKMWTVPPDEMDPFWMGDYIPSVSWERIIAGALRPLDCGIGHNATFFYPKGGISTVADALASRIRKVDYGKALVGLIREKKIAILSDGTTQKYSHLVSTIPLPILANFVGSLPAAEGRALARLDAIDLTLVDIGFREPQVSDVHWVYLPDPDVLGFRLQLCHSLEASLAPRGHGLFCVEVSHSRHRPLPKGSLTNRVLSDLIKLGWLHSEQQVTFCRERTFRNAYVLPRPGFKGAARMLTRHLERSGILSIGRYGGWKYSNMEDALVDGKLLAERLISLRA